MPDIFTYTDYRRFLADSYAAMKQRQPSFSYLCFARRAGFRNKGFLHNVIAGRKNLSAASVAKLAPVLTRTDREAEYLRVLVAFGQARTVQERNMLFDRLCTIRSYHAGADMVRELRADQYEFYSRWYYAAIRALLEIYPFKGDYRWLGSLVYPKIGVRQARKAVGVLTRLGMIKRQRDGTYRLTDKLIRPSDEVRRLAIVNFHLDVARLARDAIERLPPDKRNVTGLTLGVSQATYERICQETLKFQQRVLQMAEADTAPDRVYQYNFQIIPLSVPRGRR
jgi:uncharacterized protein (TIGR02147 family)